MLPPETMAYQLAPGLRQPARECAFEIEIPLVPAVMSAPSYSCSVNAWSASKIAQTVLRILELHSEAESDTSDSTSDADEPVTQTILDYACGRGLISQRLAPYARSIVGIDISHSAVEAYNAAARGNGLEQSEMHALQMDELRDEEGELGGRKFDLIVVRSHPTALDPLRP